MAGVRVQEVRARVAARVATLTGWRESPALASRPMPYETLTVDDAGTFGVNTPKTIDTGKLRGRPSEGLLVDTTVTVLGVVKGQAHEQANALDEALRAEDELRQHILAREDGVWPLELALHFEGAERTPRGDVVAVTLTFRCRHLLPLQ